MEIHDERYIQIFHTLEKIGRINKHIAFHKSAEHPDSYAIEQWEEVKADLVHQLQEILAELEIQINLPVAA